MPRKEDKFAYPTYWREHPVTGEIQERVADTPSQEVNLIADGWRKKKDEKSTKSSSVTSASTASPKSSGSSS